MPPDPLVFQKSLDERLKAHPGFAQVVQTLIPGGKQAFETIVRMLVELPKYTIGVFPQDVIGDIEKALPVLRKLQRLPAWRLLAQAAGELSESVWHLLIELSTAPLEPEALVDVLNELADSNEPSAFGAHLLYLKAFNAQPNCKLTHVAALKLRTQNGRWALASELCADASGVERQYLLDKDQAIALRNKVCSAAGIHAERDAGSPIEAARLDTLWEATPGLAENYFRGWETRTKGSAVGSFLATLGSLLAPLARAYLKPQSLDHVRQKLCGYTPEQGRWPDASTLGRSIETLNVVLQVVKGARVDALNLVGDPQSFPVEKNPELVVVGAPRRVKHRHNHGFIVQLAPQDHYSKMDGRELSEALRRSTRFLLRSIHPQCKNEYVMELWRELNDSEQLELEIVRRKILDNLPMYLKPLGAHRDQPIKKLLDLLNQAHSRHVEAEVRQEGQSARDKAKHTYFRCTQDLATCLATNPAAQQAVLAQIRKKLADFHYEANGILFELFQNADDAVVELARCEALGSDKLEIPEPARRFVLQTDKSTIRTLHWGRLINYRGPHGLPDRWSGFGDDLEKMLILSASDKPDDETVTGRFGLGFKSVFLVCDQPRIVSGDLQVEIHGGIFPERWKDAQRGAELLRQYSQDRQYRGTLVELGITHGSVDEVVQRFAQYAGLVSVFARALRSIHLDLDGARESIAWNPSELAVGVEIGQTTLPVEPRQTSRLLVLRTTDGSVAMRLGAHGCESMDGDFVPIWVTVPTRESEKLGFVINGAFEIDAGRGRLAGNQSGNVRKMQAIGREAGARLAALLEGHDDAGGWAARRDALGLVKDCTSAQFFTSVWQTLGKRTLAGTESDLCKLAGELVGAAFGSWCEQCGLLPNGLPGTFSAFILLRSELRQIPEAWCRIEVLSKLWKVPGFISGSISLISGSMAALLRKSGLRTTIPTYDLGCLVAAACDDERCAPDIASAMEALVLALEHDDDSFVVTEKIGAKLRFKIEIGLWSPLQEVLCTSDLPEHADERLRFEFAPPANRLDSSYSRDGIAFFIRCRRRMQAPAETLARWMIDCDDDERKRAALRYIGEGQLGREVATLIHKQLRIGWLGEVSLQHPLMLQFGPALRDEIWRQLAPKTAFTCMWPVNIAPATNQSPSYRGSDALLRIQRWWQDEAAQYRQGYLDHLYPGGRLDGLSLESGNVNRTPWMTLFALGAFQRLGRVQAHQTRGFIEYMQRKGWWEILCERHPEQHGDAWLGVLKGFAEDQQDGQHYDYWLDVFPRLYQLAYWLDRYVDLFEGLRFRSFRQLDPNLFLKPLSDPSLQGGGWGAPPLDRTMKFGVHLVVRELLRQEVIENPAACSLAYMPVKRVLQLFDAIGMSLPDESSDGIWTVLTKALGPEGATFGGDFDIPLLVLAANNALLGRICNASILDDDLADSEVFA